MKQMFFDDEKLFKRDNVRRCIGKAELIADSVYHDPVCETIFSTGWVFRIKDKYRCIYFGMCADGVKRAFCAESQDGIHFAPEDVSTVANVQKPIAKHQILALPTQEIAEIYEDKTADASCRFKMLISDYDSRAMCVRDLVFMSSDLICWSLMEGAKWGNGTEPLAGVFYNDKQHCHTVLHRPYWGIRKVGFAETVDFVHFSDYTPCVHQDALDEPLSEIYGMKALAYEGTFIGFPQVYGKLHGGLHSKFDEGTETVQLAYSSDGRYWLRFLREPFINGATDKDAFGYENKMVWISQARQTEKGDILIFTSATPAEHGHFVPGTRGTMQTYHVREDGFAFFESADTSLPSVVATREKLWHGGEAHINLTAQSATLAVYGTYANAKDAANLLSYAEPIEGFGHDDCIPFSGDSTDWVPQFKNGRKLDELKDKTIVLEVRFTAGKLYSVGGDFTDLFNVDAGRYRMFGVLPECER